MESSFGAWVKRRRRSLDLTQQELARRVGCSVSAIFKIESNERRPSRQVADLLAAVLEIPAEQRGLFLKLARQEYAPAQNEGAAAQGAAASAPDGLAQSAPEQAAGRAALPEPGGLPVPLNPLVGREHELRAICEKIQEPTCRLLTLAGPGGVGKTRLALEAARRLQEAFAPGPYFISLVGTSASTFIIPAIGDALGFTFSGQSELKEQLFRFLREKRLLLVLDNLEHLLEGIEMLDELLAYAPGVKILATSREPLNLTAEWVFEVYGLPVPTSLRPEDLAAAASAGAAASSVQLFLQRARQVNVNFSPAPADLPAITRICQLVEGLPLGLELAASWVRVTSLGEVAREIEQNLDFLTTTARDVPQRHRSMRAVFDQSWSQLNAEERRALGRLSVFRAGFTREAAAQAAGANLPLLSALVDTSFVRRSGPRRYDLHELTRQYAAARLREDAGEARAAQADHAAFYLTLLAESEPVLRSSAQRERLEALKLEIENIRAAWDAAVESGAVDLLHRAAGGYYYFYELLQFFHEAEDGYRRAAAMIQAEIAAVERQNSPTAEARAVLEHLSGALAEMEGQRAFFLQRSGRNREALDLYHHTLERLRGLDAPFLSAYTLIFTGIVTWAVGAFEEAERCFAEGLPLAQHFKHPWLRTIGLCFLGALEHDQGRYDAADEHFRASLGLARENGDPYFILLIGTLYSRTARARGSLTQAQDLLGESVRLARESGNRWAVGLGLEQLAVIAQQTGDAPGALAMLEESVAMHRDVGDAWSLSRALLGLSQVALAQGDLTLAEQSAREGCRVAARDSYLPNALESLASLAVVRARLGQPAQALEMALRVLRHPASPQQARDQAESLRMELEAAPRTAAALSAFADEEYLRSVE